MRLRTSFQLAILACAVAFNIAMPLTVRSQQYAAPQYGGQQFAGQQFSGRYPNVVPTPSAPMQGAPAAGSGTGYYAAAMQSGGAPNTAPPSMPHTYPRSPMQPPTQTIGPTSAPFAQAAAAPTQGPLAGIKTSLGKFANPAAPQIPPAPTPSPRQLAWSGAVAPASYAAPSAGAPPRNQTAGYNAPVSSNAASPYAGYAAAVAARVTGNASTVTPAAYTQAVNAAARPNVALQSRGPNYGSPYLQANNQPTLAPGVSAGNAPGLDSAPNYSPQVLAAPGLSAPAPAPSYTQPNFAAQGTAPPAGGGFVGPNYDATVPANAGPGNFGPSYYGAGASGTGNAPPSGYGNPAGPNASMWQQPAVPDPISGGYGGAGYGDPNYMGQESANYDPGVDYFAPGRQCCGPWFASVSALIMTRDVPNNVGLAYLGADPHVGSALNTDTAGFDWKGGIEAKVGRMIGDRWAMEAVWWGLDPSHGTLRARSEANEINSRLDMTTVFYQGAPLSGIYENSREQLFYRADSFQNIELNLLQQALVVDPQSRFGMAYFMGARYFKYREIIDYYSVAANSEFSDGDMSTASGYHVRVRNSLIGWQVGARGHLYLGQRLRLYATPRVGLFANQISQHQELCMVIDLRSTKTDVAVLGQLELGASYQIFNCCSVFAGYRVMGIAGVANADDNIARDFNSQPDMAEINSSGSIILHGVNTGIQFQF